MTTRARWLPTAAGFGFAIVGALTLWSAKRPAAAGPAAALPAPVVAPAAAPVVAPAAGPAATPKPALPLRMGVIGDSASCSYASQSWKMMTAHPLSLVDLLVASGGADFGPRVAATPGQASGGYARTWAGYGYSTADVLAKQLDVAAALALATNEVDIVMVAVGHDDFQPLLTARLRGNHVGAAEVEAMLAGFTQRYAAILDRLLATKRGTVIVHNLVDWYRLPFVSLIRLPANDYQRLVETTDRVNAIIAAAAATRHLPLVDLRAAFASLTERQPFELAGIRIETGTTGNEPCFFFLPDGIHPGTVASAWLLNDLLARWRPLLGVTLPPLADEQIVRLAELRPPLGRPPLAAPRAALQANLPHHPQPEGTRP